MMSKLLSKYSIGSKLLKNRVVMAPMTRSRTSQPGDIPNDIMAKYFEQRSSAGLIITDATQISVQGKGYSFTPGIYSEDQIEGWMKVTHAVHNNGGKIFIQLWHVGRMSHKSLHPDNRTVAPSSIAPNAKVWIADEFGIGKMVECPRPEELTVDEIQDIVSDYKTAASNAKLAGFDGIEIHAGNGYLLDEFLRTSSNKRNDLYGGNIDNRIRLIEEIVDAVSQEFDINLIGLRLSPHNTSRGMHCPEIIETVYELLRKLEKRNLGYVHFAEADWDEAPVVPLEFRRKVRNIFSGSVIVAGNYDKNKGEKILEDHLADLVAYGRLFVSNPDLVERFENNLQLEIYNHDTLFGGSEIGYSDYKNHSKM